MQIESMPLSKLAAQLVMPRVSADLFYSDDKYKTEIIKLVEEGIGGFCVFVGGVEETANMISELQKLSEIQLMFSADFENGLPMRLNGGTSFPHAMALGKNDNYDDTYAVASAIALEANNIGIHWIFAPVCDINSNPDNPIINIRSFGENTEIVSRHSQAFIKGIQDAGLIASAKHFPGHGDTSQDSHLTLPKLEQDLQRIENIELQPFINSIKIGVQSIMIAHLSVPALDDSLLPASLSKKIINDLLINKLGFKGLIVTDALDMKAITNSFSCGQASTMAIEAGADIVLLPENPLEAIQSIIEKAENYESFKNRLIESASKFINLKSRLSAEKKSKDIKSILENHEKLALKVAFSALTISGTSENYPVKPENIISGFAFIQGEDIMPGAEFFKMFAQACENDCDFGFIDENISNDDLEIIKESTNDADTLLLLFFYKARAYHGSIGISENLKSVIKELSYGKKTIAVLFGNPYLKDEISADVIISAYSDSLPSIAAVVMKLAGRNPEDFFGITNLNDLQNDMN